ncbi:MAG: hypothetical protein HC927_09735 [Deltaproteobacteria bacterium]|nr:hypothetical protein [Deltaproteobacteria bacterium]
MTLRQLLILTLPCMLVLACETSDDGSDEVAEDTTSESGDTTSESGDTTSESGDTTSESGDTEADPCTDEELAVEVVQVEFVEDACQITPTEEVACVPIEGLDGCTVVPDYCLDTAIYTRELEPGKWAVVTLTNSCNGPSGNWDPCLDPDSNPRPECDCFCR